MITRREFIGKGAVGLTALGFSPTLLNALLVKTGSSAGGAGLEDLMIPEDVLNKAVEFLMSKGADFGDVFVERAAFDLIGSDDKKINTSTSIEKGVGVRVVKEGKTYYAYTDSFAAEDVYKTAQFVADAAAQGVGGRKALINMELATSKLSFPITPNPDEVADSKKIEYIQKLTDRAWSSDDRVNQVSQFFREIIRQVNIATSSGKIINQTLGLTEFYAATYMKDKTGNLQVGGDSRGAHAGMSFFKGENSLEAVVDKSVDRAQKLMEAVDSPRGQFPVVLGPGVTGVIFHESCGHGMEADLVYKGSNFKDKIGKRTAAKGVTLIDDGTIPEMPGSYAFDDEGTPSERTVLIEDGIQQNYLCDLVWAEKLGMKSTGSGRRQSFRYPPIPRMRNTFIDGGNIPADDIIKSTKKGLYVASAGGGQVDVITGNFMMGVPEGYLIENGKITKPVKGATLSGMGIKALETIDMVGNDLVIHAGAGRCGKFQTAPTGFGMPTTRVRGMLVGGPGEAWDDVEGGSL